MNLQKISFGPNLAKCIIDENLRLDLLKYGELQKISAKQQLAGRIQKEFFFDSISKQKVESRVISYIENYLQTISQFEGIDGSKFKVVLNSLWINYQKAGECNPPHKHTGDISFAMYLNVPNEIKNEVNDTKSYPNGSITFIHGTDTQLTNQSQSQLKNKILGPNNVITILPNTNDMFIFPAYLIHYVEPFYTDGVERISISGNISILN